MLGRKTGRRLALLMLLAIVGMFALAACGGDDDVASAAQDTCDALGDFRAAGQAIPLDPTSASKDDFDDAVDDAKDALENVLDAASDTQESAVDELSGAFEELEDTIDDNSDASLGELASAVGPQVQNIIDTWNQVQVDLQCTETPAE